MKKVQMLLVMVFLMLCVSNATAQDNGTIVENAPCPANTVGTFEQYAEAAKKRYVSEIESAKQEGFTMKPSADLPRVCSTKKNLNAAKSIKVLNVGA